MKNTYKKGGSKSWDTLSRKDKVIGLVGLAVIIIIALGIIGAIGSGINNSFKTKDSQPKQVEVANKPANTAKKQPQANQQQSTNNKPEPKKEADLAKEVKSKFLEQMDYKSLSELQTDPNTPASKSKYINGFEDVSSGTVRVFVQTDITKDEARGIGKNIMGLVGFDIKNLDWIVVRGTDGRDVNVSRNDIPALRR